MRRPIARSPALDGREAHRTATTGVTFAARLRFQGIGHRYGSSEVLRDIDLIAEPGKVLCLLGPSGSGKTTLLRIAAGIEQQTAGTILLNDREIAGPTRFLPPEKRSIGLVFQDFALFPHLTLLDNVRFGLTALSSADGKREAAAALQRVGLAKHAESYPHMLSGGQQQRVALARALAPRPAVLLMDEPFSGLDSRLKDQVRADTLSILRSSRTTAVIVTHDAEEAMRVADQIALLKDGRLVQIGTAEELYHRPVDLFTARFFSEFNLFESVPVVNGQVETPLGSFDASDVGAARLADVAIRTVGISVHPDGEGTEARIVSRRFIGTNEVLELALSGTEERVRVTIREGRIEPDARDVKLVVQPRDVLVFASADD